MQIYDEVTRRYVIAFLLFAKQYAWKKRPPQKAIWEDQPAQERGRNQGMPFGKMVRTRLTAELDQEAKVLCFPKR